MIAISNSPGWYDRNMSDPAVFAPSALSAVVHDKTQPNETRRKAARLLIPHLQAELARLREERGACARDPGALRERFLSTN